MKLHSVVMIKASHHLDLFNKTLFSILLAVGSLFRKGFDSVMNIFF